MAHVSFRVRKETGKFVFDIRVGDLRIRPQTNLKATKVNERLVEGLAKKMNAEIEVGTFDIEKYFPNSDAAKKVAAHQAESEANARAKLDTKKPPEQMTFAEFAQLWVEDMEIEWRRATKRFYRSLLNTHLLPTFGEKVISDITRDDLLEFRKELAKVKSRNGSSTISNRTINSVMTLLKAIMDEAAYRLETTKVTGRIQKLRISRTKVQPFTLKEVFAIADTIHEDYRDYIIVRFFTGMRPSELHGLTWDKIDFDRKEIVVDVTLNTTDMEDDETKTPTSQRIIDMNPLVLNALRSQKQRFGRVSPYVFCNSAGSPIDTKNFQIRVWNTALTSLGLMIRRPYQTRHTAATLWLSSGENPEWIARQLGHSSTQMLFTTYSRWVPNLTRKDGSAFEAMLQTNGFIEEQEVVS